MSEITETNTRLSRPVDPARDHLLGPGQAPITLLEYGSYACPHCRAANEHIRAVRTSLGDRAMSSDIARSAAATSLAARQAGGRAPTEALFWRAHVTLMTRSDTLTEEDLKEVSTLLGLDRHGTGKRRTMPHAPAPGR